MMVPLRARHMVLLAAMALILMSCADDNTTPSDTTVTTAVLDTTVTTAVLDTTVTTAISDNTVTLRVSGGITGIDETTVIHEDGRVVVNDQPIGNPVPEKVAGIFAQVRDGFFELSSSYLPADTCCDRFTYEITAVVDGHTHSVTTMDATAEAPDELMLLIDSLRELVYGT